MLEIPAKPFDPTLSRDASIEQLRRKMEETLGKVVDAVNEAPPGRIVAGLR